MNARESPILVWGAGAIGGTVGAYLVRAGHRVDFVDVDSKHVAAIRDTGLHIHGPVDEFTVEASAVTPAGLEGLYDLVFLAVKAHHTETAARQLASHLAEDGAVVSLQNGLNELVISEIVGRERTIGAFINFGADVHGPGHILYANRGPVVVGELHGTMSERATRIHRRLQDFEPDAVLSDNIWGYLWGKLGYGALLKASALTDAPIADYIAAPDYRGLHIALAREMMLVATAEGVTPLGFSGFDPEAFLAATDHRRLDAALAGMAAYNRASPKSHSGIWRDLSVRKRKTDVAAQLAPAVAAAMRHGIAVPLTEKLIELIAEIEDGKRGHGWSTADVLKAAMPVVEKV
ncbi:MAG: 2-dehydropantoate 2-reductase [Alphaproteobacteria bacterium]|jgi:2-dehydropantoate 2-reductase|nr:2-dehydropantoate 2-reductase [Alphaproteobacteria bacterium]